MKLRSVWALCLSMFLSFPGSAVADELPEYRLKAAFLYNFALFTEWPADVGNTLNVCIHGDDPFGKEIDALQGKVVGGRSIALRRKCTTESLKGCQLAFIAASAIGNLPRVLKQVQEMPILTVADSPGAAAQGVVLNMAVAQNKVSFEANLKAARAATLSISSKLLRLATEVHQ